jgi:hypothetical protein
MATDPDALIGRYENLGAAQCRNVYLCGAPGLTRVRAYVDRVFLVAFLAKRMDTTFSGNPGQTDYRLLNTDYRYHARFHKRDTRGPSPETDSAF